MKTIHFFVIWFTLVPNGLWLLQFHRSSKLVTCSTERAVVTWKGTKPSTWQTATGTVFILFWEFSILTLQKWLSTHERKQSLANTCAKTFILSYTACIFLFVCMCVWAHLTCVRSLTNLNKHTQSHTYQQGKWGPCAEGHDMAAVYGVKAFSRYKWKEEQRLQKSWTTLWVTLPGKEINVCLTGWGKGWLQ